MPTPPQPGTDAVTDIPVEIYGADWCEDTRRTRRLLRRLAVAHRYHDVDEDLEALERATALNNGVRRTPVVHLAGAVLVEPTNDALAGLLVDRRMLTRDEIDERLHVQNVGDAERCLRVGVGLMLVAAAPRLTGLWRGPVRLLGSVLLVSGTAGWCPVYQAKGVSSLNGPGDRPDEAERKTWLRSVNRPAGVGPRPAAAAVAGVGSGAGAGAGAKAATDADAGTRSDAGAAARATSDVPSGASSIGGTGAVAGADAPSPDRAPGGERRAGTSEPPVGRTAHRTAD